ncbi:unnamed protein product [Dibothriocephalus latus]|uniref:Uncharacterized protein n=1 Tax=Dibothriocephalus latus TaxID=60516 RepID=A0A3P6QWR6_DIBLA|nr:unnamed protein product [Dibothriocephalus latus]
MPAVLLVAIFWWCTDSANDRRAALLTTTRLHFFILDLYLVVTVDLNRLFFICTTNQLNTTPDPLRDQTEMAEVSGYVVEDKMIIAH